MDEQTQIQCLETQLNERERTIAAQRKEIEALHGKVEAYETSLDVFGKVFDCLKAISERDA